MGLWIGPPSAGRVSISFGQAAVLNAGLTITDTSTPIYVHLDNCGCALQEDIHAIGSGAGISLPVLEVIESTATGQHHTDEQ